ncbi:MAG: hypothetical protein Q9166_002169 [cf. Caloplaca sp. 2 TL-2023]
MPATNRTRPYRELLTPCLHRRFTHAAGISLLLCYLEAVIIGDKSSLIWSWFPLGKAGIRTLLLFICPLLVFVLRVALLHFGDRSTASPLQTFRRYLGGRDVLEALFCYVGTAWIFTQIYIWSVPADADLGWIIQGRSWERQRLNERPIYLRSLYLGLGLLQTALHLYYDYDKIRRPIDHTQSAEKRPGIALRPLTQLKSDLLQLLPETGGISLGLSIVGPIIYAFTIRRVAWRISMFWARFLRYDIPHTAELSMIPPYHITLIFRSLVSGFLLLLLWRVSNSAFDVYVAQEPLKRGQPLSQDSRDPNGVLINGLQSKKSLLKTFAFWELAEISRNFPDRRILIFRDIDRQGGPTWGQISSECLKAIQGVTTRITEYGQPSAQQQALSRPQEVQSLPRIGVPLKQDPVFVNPPPPSSRREMVETKVGSLAKSIGDNPVSSYRSPLTPKTQQYLEAVRNKLLTPEQQQTITSTYVKSQFYIYLTSFLQSWFGQPFRQTFTRRVQSIIFGQPFSELTLIVDAVESLANLTTASIKEDDYGKVAKDVPLILRTFIITYQNLEQFTATLPVHWTDVEFSEDQRHTEDVLALLSAVRHGLQELVNSFGGFSAELDIAARDIRIAKAIAGIAEP